MKMDRKLKAASRSTEIKANGKSRGANTKPASKSSSKHPLISYEHIPIGIVETSLDGKFLNVNEEFCRITGYERQELLQLSIKDVTHEEDYSFDIQLHERLIAGKIPYYKIEKRLKCKEGGVVWVELTRSLVRGPRGAARYSVGAVLDISDRKHVERVLRESVERQRLATEAARMFTWEWNFQIHLYTLSDSFVQVLGFSRDLLPQNNIDDVFKLIPADDVQQIHRAVGRAIESRSDLRSLQYRMINPENGEIVWLEVSGKIVYDDLGNAVRMFGVAQNITENKKAEAALEFARRQAEQSADRTARLQKITAALSAALTPSQVAEVLATEGAPAFGAVSSSMLLLHDEDQTLEIMHSTALESLTLSYRRFPLSLNVPAAEAARSRQPVWIESQQQYLERYPHLADQIKLWGYQAAVAIPMVSKERILGVLTMSFEQVLVFNLDDQDYALTLARQGAQALERARAEEALRESEERFRALVSQATAGISQSDTNNQLVFVNPKFCEMLGYPKPELLGKTIWELTHPDDLEENRRLFEGMISRGESYQFEKRFVRRDGSILWANVSVSPIRDMFGKPKGGVGVIIDVTERKRIEGDLRESEERYRAVVESQVEMLCRFQMDGRILFANAAYARARGTTPEALMNRNFWEFIPEEDHQAVKAILDTLTPDTPEVQIENRFEMAEGERWTLWTNRALKFDANGQILEAQSSGIDITERKQAENRLALLADVSEMLRNFQDPYELMYTIARAIGEHFRVRRVLFNEIDLAHDREIVHRDYHNGLPSVAGIHKISDYSSITSAEVATGKTVVNADSKTDPRTAQDYEKTYALSGERSYVAIPMMRGDQWAASLWVSDDVPRTWSPEEISLLETIAERTWTVIEKQRINTALQESEQRFREIFETAGVSVWLEDFTRVKGEIEKLRLQGIHDFHAYFTENPDFVRRAISLVRVLDVNNETLDLFRAQSKEELLGSLSKVFAPETQEIFIEELVALAEGQEMLRSETQIRTLDGSPISVLFTVHFGPQTDDHSHVVVTLTDITERKQAEEALRQSEERFARFMQHLPGLAWIKDIEGRYVYANAAAESAFNTPLEKLYGSSDEEIFPPEVAAQFRSNDERALQEEKGVQVIETMEQTDGVLHYSLVSKFPIPGPDGSTALIGGTAFDITERRKAEEALRDSEERFRAILRQATAGIVRKDAEGRLIFVNQAFCNMLGYTETELLGKTVWEFMHPDDVAENKQSYERLIVEGIPFNLERRFLCQDGSVIWVDASVSPVMDTEGKLQSAVAVEIDITGRKLAEQALRASEERYRNLFELVPIAVYSCDTQGLIDAYNHRAIELWGREPAKYDVNERYCGSYKIFYPDGTLMPHEQCPMARALNGEALEPHEFEVIVEREDGVRRNVIAHPLILRDELGEITGAINCLYDITERKQAEEALHQLNLQLENRVQQRTARLNDAIQTLRDEIAERRKVEEALRRSEAAARENEEKLSTLFDLLPVGISFLDLNGQVIQTNPALENILKLPKEKEQLSGQVHTSRQYIRPNGTLMPASEFASQRALTEQRTVYNVETGIVLEDGTVTWTSVSAAPVAVADVGAVVVTVDITEGKRAERALQESRERLQILSQRLVEVQEEERRAIARELHDRVGQTLAALNINLIIINGQLADKVDQQVSGRLSDSMKLVTETITLVRDVMSNLRPSVLDDYGLEAALQSYLDEYMRRYEIKVTMDRAASPIPRLGSSIEMTFLRIAQEALMNIARHAQASHITLSLRQDGGAICMTVQDNGVGIQSGKEGRRPGSHGLTIMRERAEAFGGTLQVVSAPGQGTRVEVKIPVENNPPSWREKELLQ